MFVPVVETALQMSSSTLSAFIFCNLLILMILLGSKFSSSDSNKTRPDQIERMSRRPVNQAEEKLALVQVSEVCNSEINRKEEQEDNGREYENEDADWKYEYESGNEDNGEEDNGDDDELRRRIEYFITKVNREWKEENLKDSRPKLTLLDQPLALITQEA